MFQDVASPVSHAVGPVSASAKPGGGSPVAPMLPWDELPGLLRRRAGWIFGAVVLALVAALLFIALVKPIYTADTELIVQPTDLQATSGAVNPVSNQPDTSVALVETAARVITSTKVLGRVVDDLDLERDPEFTRRPSHLKALIARIRQTLGISAISTADDPSEDAVQQLAKRVTVRRSERTFVIDISVKSQTPDKAAQIANAIADTFLQVQADMRAEAARRISGALTDRLSELRDTLRRKEDAVQSFKVAHKLSIANGRPVDEQQMSDASSQLLTAQSRVADAKARLDQILAAGQGQDLGAIPESLQSATVTALRSQLAQVSKQEADARVTLGARHPQMLQMESQVAAVRRALNEELQRIRSAARSEYDRARANEASLRSNLARQEAKGAGVAAAQIRLGELQRDADASRSVYEAFLLRARETAEQERVDTVNAWVASPATPPSDHSFPPSNLAVLGAALVAGLGCGLACAVAREHTDARLWSRSRVEAVTHLPVLGIVDAPRPRAFPWGRKPLRGFPSVRSMSAQDGVLDLLGDLTSGRPTASGRVLLLLGANGGEAALPGAAQWLAEAAAMSGRKVVLASFSGAADPGRTSMGTVPAAKQDRVQRLDMPDAGEPWEMPLVIERLKSCSHMLDGGLLIVSGTVAVPALPQLTTMADAIVLVLSQAQTTKMEVRTLMQRIGTKMDALRGSLLIQRWA